MSAEFCADRAKIRRALALLCRPVEVCEFVDSEPRASSDGAAPQLRALHEP
jgi:hypothetical protein